MVSNGRDGPRLQRTQVPIHSSWLRYLVSKSCTTHDDVVFTLTDRNSCATVAQRLIFCRWKRREHSAERQCCIAFEREHQYLRLRKLLAKKLSKFESKRKISSFFLLYLSRSNDYYVAIGSNDSTRARRVKPAEKSQLTQSMATGERQAVQAIIKSSSALELGSAFVLEIRHRKAKTERCGEGRSDRRTHAHTQMMRRTIERCLLRIKWIKEWKKLIKHWKVKSKCKISKSEGKAICL